MEQYLSGRGYYIYGWNKKLIAVGTLFGEWINSLKRTTKADIENDPQFDGLVFDEDKEELNNPNNEFKAEIWDTLTPAFNVWKLARKFPDANGLPSVSVILACLQERKADIEINLERINIIQSGFSDSQEWANSGLHSRGNYG